MEVTNVELLVIASFVVVIVTSAAPEWRPSRMTVVAWLQTQENEAKPELPLNTLVENRKLFSWFDKCHCSRDVFVKKMVRILYPGTRSWTNDLLLPLLVARGEMQKPQLRSNRRHGSFPPVCPLRPFSFLVVSWKKRVVAWLLSFVVRALVHQCPGLFVIVFKNLTRPYDLLLTPHLLFFCFTMGIYFLNGGIGSDLWWTSFLDHGNDWIVSSLCIIHSSMLWDFVRNLNLFLLFFRRAVYRRICARWYSLHL